MAQRDGIHSSVSVCQCTFWRSNVRDILWPEITVSSTGERRGNEGRRQSHRAHEGNWSECLCVKG